jgi:hypothetical protein
VCWRTFARHPGAITTRIQGLHWQLEVPEVLWLLLVGLPDRGLVVVGFCLRFGVGAHRPLVGEGPFAQGDEPLGREVPEPAVTDAVDAVEDAEVGVEVVEVVNDPP